MLAKVVEARKLLSAMTAEGTLAGVFPEEAVIELILFADPIEYSLLPRSKQDIAETLKKL